MDDKKRVWEITYIGKGVSLNDFYSQGKFYKRVNIKNTYSEIFRNLIDKAKVEFIDQYVLTCIYNSRHDPSNIAGMIKMFEDTLTGDKNRKTGIYKYPPLIADDSKKYCKGIEIYPDLKMKANHFKFIIKEQ